MEEKKNTGRPESIDAASLFPDRIGRGSRVSRRHFPRRHSHRCSASAAGPERRSYDDVSATAARRFSVFRYSQCGVDDGELGGREGGRWEKGGGLHVKLSDWV